MEILLRLFGAVILLVKFITLPVFWCKSLKKKKTLPQIGDQLLRISATNLAKDIRNRKISSQKIIEAYIKRIKEVNTILNAVVEDRFEAAVEDAKKVDKFLATTLLTKEELEEQKPLLGVPVTIKESCRLKGLSHGVGSLTRFGVKAEEDGEAVRRLKEAGGIPLLVSNTAELCLSWESNNLVTGSTCNPYDTNRSSGGSSGGEGALIASAASVIGLGSDIAGSIRIPALFNGIFGHKPTAGLIPIDGHYPYSEAEHFNFCLVMGPMARYVEDLSLMMKVLAKDDIERLDLNSKIDLSTLNVYYMYDAGFSLVHVPVQSEIKSAIQIAVSYLQAKCKATAIRANFKEIENSSEISCSIFHELSQLLPNILKASDDSESDHILFVEFIKHCFGTSKFSLSVLMFYLMQFLNKGMVGRNSKHYLAECKAFRELLTNTLGTNGVFIYPTFPVPAIRHGEVYYHVSGVPYCTLFNGLGLPSTNVPFGIDRNKMPLGFQVIAAPYQDRLCLAVAAELEKACGGWRPPEDYDRMKL